MKLTPDQLWETTREAVEHGTAVIPVSGTSMRPFLNPQTDTVRMARRPGGAWRRGDMVLARTHSHGVVLHAVIGRDAGGCYLLQGTGNLQQVETASPDGIAGYAAGRLRRGREVSADSWQWRLAMTLWLAFRPVRRVLLHIF